MTPKKKGNELKTTTMWVQKGIESGILQLKTKVFVILSTYY